jgi:hypothetical protein
MTFVRIFGYFDPISSSDLAQLAKFCLKLQQLDL